MKLVASRGGTHDHLIESHKLRSARVVYSEREAKRKWKLKIDHDDSLVWNYDKDFAILLHGTMPAGSKAMKAVMKLRKKGVGGYKSDYFKAGSGKKKKTVTMPTVIISPKVNGFRAVVIKNKAGTIKIHSSKMLYA